MCCSAGWVARSQIRTIVGGVRATGRSAESCSRVRERWRWAGKGAVRRAKSDKVNHRKTGGTRAVERRRCVDQSNLAGRRAHRYSAGRLGCWEALCSTRSGRFLYQVILPGRQRARQRCRLPTCAGCGGVLNAPAGEIYNRRTAIKQFDEIVTERRAAVSAASVDLADNHLRLRGDHRSAQCQKRDVTGSFQRKGLPGQRQDSRGSEYGLN